MMINCHIRSFHQKDNCVLMLASFPWMSDWLIIGGTFTLTVKSSAIDNDLLISDAHCKLHFEEQVKN